MFASLAVTLLLAMSSPVFAATIYLAGDSTMARNNGGVIDGWGNHLQQFFKIPVVNNAIGGRSARSFTEEGRFTAIANVVKPGDWVIMAFGHNDGSAGAVDNGRQSAVGDSYAATATVKNAAGQNIVIHTFPYYLENAINLLQSKGANVILGSPTPRNGWANGKVSAPNRFTGYASLASSRAVCTFINHYAHQANAFNNLGQAKVQTLYNAGDLTHTNPAGALVSAKAFVRGLLCGSNGLRGQVTDAGKAVPNGCTVPF